MREHTARRPLVADSDPPPFLFLSLSLSFHLPPLYYTQAECGIFPHPARTVPAGHQLAPPLAPADRAAAATRLSRVRPQPWQLANSGSRAEYCFPAWLRPVPRETVACREWSCTNRARSTCLSRASGDFPVTLASIVPTGGRSSSSCGAADEDNARRSSSQLRGWRRSSRGGLSSPRREERTTTWRSKV